MDDSYDEFWAAVGPEALEEWRSIKDLVCRDRSLPGDPARDTEYV